MAILEEVKQPLAIIAPDDDGAAIQRLANLSPLEYERIRENEAKRLGIQRVAMLDKLVKNEQQIQLSKNRRKAMFPAIEIWPEPVDGEMLLNEIASTIKRFIICDPEIAVAVSLWCAFTWLIDKVQVAPLAVITSPEMRCGKSQLLTLIGKLSCRPLLASNISPAAMFRVIEAYSPTLLVDEADTFVKDNEVLRGVINSGHTRQAAYIIRTVGDNYEPRQFSTWSAKAICGIGSLAATIHDRAIIFALRRKLPSEAVQRLRHADKELFDRLASQLAKFAENAGLSIENAMPSLPEDLNDRAQDNWEPLLAIADYAGGVWPEMARRAALKISGAKQEVSRSTELLTDIREIFDENNIDRISTFDLLKCLNKDASKPWSTHNRNEPLTAHQLSFLLKGYKVSSKNIKFGHSVKKGFEKSQFQDIFSRYLPPLSDTKEIPATSLPISHK